MKKRGVVLFFAVVITIAALLASLPTARLAEDIYFVAVNDTVKPLSRETMPFLRYGYMYVSYSVFEDSTLGVNAFYNDRLYTLTLFNRDYQITFDSLTGIAYDRNEQYDMKLAGNAHGKIFVPLSFVCERFGLKYEDLRTSPARTLRIVSRSTASSGEDFIESKGDYIARAYVDYVFPPSPSPSPSVATTTPRVSPSPSPPPLPSPSPLPSPEAPRVVYLTFDDGPSDSTADILDLLERFDVRATFFLSGADIADNTELVRRMVGEGHVVGLHCDRHDDGALYASSDALAEEYRAAQTLLDAAVGIKTRLVRLPGGSKNELVTADMRDRLIADGYRYWDYNVDGYEGGRASRALSTAVINGMNGRAAAAGAVVALQHTDTTVDALQRILGYLQDGNFTTRTISVSEMPRNLWNDVRSVLSE